MSWTKLWFGKHDGKTLPQVLFADPDWFFWAMEDGVFDGKRGLADDARVVNWRARRIRVPTSANGVPQEVEYLIHPPTGRFGDVEVVPADRPLHDGGSPAFRRDCFDLSVPRQIDQYDKTGCTTMIQQLKAYLFGSESYRMTKRRCEAFFDDEDNFCAQP